MKLKLKDIVILYLEDDKTSYVIDFTLIGAVIIGVICVTSVVLIIVLGGKKTKQPPKEK